MRSPRALLAPRGALGHLGAAGLRPIDAITMLSSNELYALSDEEVLAFGPVSDAYVVAEAQRHWSDQDNQTILYRKGRITSYTPPREDNNGRMQKARELERRPAASAAVGVDIGRKYRFPSMSIDRAVTLFNRILIAHLHRAPGGGMAALGVSATPHADKIRVGTARDLLYDGRPSGSIHRMEDDVFLVYLGNRPVDRVTAARAEVLLANPRVRTQRYGG